MSRLAGCDTPLTRKCPPPPPVSQKSYWVIASPSASLAVNNAEAAKTCPLLAARLALVGITIGGVSVADVVTVTVKLDDQGLHWVPSLARTQRVSVPEPLW